MFYVKFFFLDSCKDNDKELSPSFIKANSARDCFEFLEEEGLFTPSDVIFVQFLLRASNCGELYEKCIEYATTQKRLCYYEEPRSKIFFSPFSMINAVCYYSSALAQKYIIATSETVLSCMNSIHKPSIT